LELDNGKIITGRSSEIMGASAALILNSLKSLAGIADDMMLISPLVLDQILNLKESTLSGRKTGLNGQEILIALSICAATNPAAQAALDKIPSLKNCLAHSTTILSSSDEETFRKLGVEITCDAEYQTESLFYGN
ncbi:MAG: DUF1846 family protein, partial [Clostridiaceae bacterium]|nr:DUF1846 family protein [Clostridiaceae bacterium]